MTVDELLASAPALVRGFDAEQRARWHHHAAALLEQAQWEAARGFSVTSQMRRTIAANAAVLTAGFATGSRPFANVHAIIVHPGGFTQPYRSGSDGNGGIASDAPLHAAGMAVGEHGPVVLSWATIEWERRHPRNAHNVIYHEFAHKLDYLNGIADGTPPLSVQARREWEQTIGTNFRRLRRRGGDGLIDEYGATNQAEYFAVLTEVFFSRPDELARRLPRVFERLAEFFNQRPTDAAVAALVEHES